MRAMAGWIVAGGLCVGLTACCCIADASEMRTWSDASGKFSVQATLKEKSDTAVTLVTADGRVVEVPIARLSAGDKALITLVAKIGRGEQQRLSYRMMGGRSQETSTATLVPFTADLEIRSGQNVLWQRSSTNHVPMMLRLEEGETVQDAVKRYEKPDPGFFGRLNLPPRIPRPEVVDQIGMSSLKDGEWMDNPAAIRNRTRRLE